MPLGTPGGQRPLSATLVQLQFCLSQGSLTLRASVCRQHGLICLGSCSVVRNRELLRSRKNPVTGAVVLYLSRWGPREASILGFSLARCQKSWLSQVIAMFRRLTLNFHDEVGLTVVALYRRASSLFSCRTLHGHLPQYHAEAGYSVHKAAGTSRRAGDCSQ